MIRSILSRPAYEEQTAVSRESRMAWWRDARYGMFIHYGLHTVLGRNEWAMALENWPIDQYEKLAEQFRPKPGCAREWVALAKQAGMKYAVLTTRHHEGFSLWDSQANPYNVVRRSPGGYDIVREFVDACREAGLRVGLYFSLMDWHHPDSWRCAFDVEARLRFHAFLKDMLCELLGGTYGKIDILWYDVARPLESAEGWDSLAMNQLVREMQPEIIINNRSKLNEDFSTPEEHITAAEAGRAWESCMTFNRISWGYIDPTQVGPYSYNAQGILRMLHSVCQHAGNLLLNIGPKIDGSVPHEAVEPLQSVGRWLVKNGPAVYGMLDRSTVFHANGVCSFTQRGNSVYVWQWIWTTELILGGFMNPPKAVRILADGRTLPFDYTPGRITIPKMPTDGRDRIANVTILEMEFISPPVHYRCSHYPQLHLGRDLH